MRNQKPKFTTESLQQHSNYDTQITSNRSTKETKFRYLAI